MPVDKHLNWVEITDFTAGLYDELPPSQQVLGPVGAFASLVDYEPRPMPGGGLRAFYQGSAITTTGITNPSTSISMGIWATMQSVRPNVGGGNALDQILVTIDTSTNKAHVWRMDITNGQNQWHQVYADAAGAGSAGFQFAEFAQFLSTGEDGATLNTLYLMVLRGGSAVAAYQLFYVPGNYTVSGNTPSGPPTNGGNADGKFEQTSVDGVSSNINVGPMIVNQARVIYSHGGTIVYSDVGRTAVSSSASNSKQPNPSQPDATLAMLSGAAPSDVMIAFNGAPWMISSGDISSAATPIREMGADHTQRQHIQHPVRFPGGIAFIEPGGKVYVTDGRTFKSLSDHIKRFNVDIGSASGPGQLAFMNHYLFAPGGHVFDLDTGAWFTSSLMPTSAFHYGEPTGNIFMTNAVAPVSIAQLRIYEGGDATVKRMPTASGQTVPFGDATGRNVRIRNVEFFVQCYATSTITVSIMDSGNNVVSTWSEANCSGREAVEFLFPNVEDDYLSVAFTCSANDGVSEAPTIERMRIAFGQNNILTGANAPE